MGETFEVAATVFREGHDALGVNLVLRDPRGRAGQFLPMTEAAPTPTATAWRSPRPPKACGRTPSRRGATRSARRHAARIKVPAGIDTELVLEEGALLLERAAAGVSAGGPRAGAGRRRRAARRHPSGAGAARCGARPAVTLALAASRCATAITSSPRYPLQVERQRALFGSWYEMFPVRRAPRSTPRACGRRCPDDSFRTAMERLPADRRDGLRRPLPAADSPDRTRRKGPNNGLEAGRTTRGRPGRSARRKAATTASTPTWAPSRTSTPSSRARELRLEVALDFALQVSPDPWVEKHPDWFAKGGRFDRLRGEPAQKYQDIYPVNFDEDFNGIVRETLRVLRFWMARRPRVPRRQPAL
ncbi:maltotransferase domain-containing protein [Yinghuangia aomiensis]